MFGAEVTNDGRFILLYETRDCDPECRLSFIDLSLGENTLTPKSTIKVVVDEFRASYTCESHLICCVLNFQISQT